MGGDDHTNLLCQLHLYLLPDLLPLLVAAHGKDVAVLQLLLAGTVPKLHGQQLFPHPAREGPCQGRAKVSKGQQRSGDEVPDVTREFNKGESIVLFWAENLYIYIKIYEFVQNSGRIFWDSEYLKNSTFSAEKEAVKRVHRIHHDSRLDPYISDQELGHQSRC